MTFNILKTIVTITLVVTAILTLLHIDFTGRKILLYGGIAFILGETVYTHLKKKRK